MRKFLAVAMVVAMVLLSVPLAIGWIAQDISKDKDKETLIVEAVQSYVKELFIQPEVVEDWKDGLLKEYALNLQKPIEVVINTTGVKENEVAYGVSLDVNLVCYCTDTQGLLKRWVRNQVILVVVDKATNMIVHEELVVVNDPEILDGWYETGMIIPEN